jgi:hypothetical protein
LPASSAFLSQRFSTSQSAVFFSHNKSALATSQPNEALDVNSFFVMLGCFHFFFKYYILAEIDVGMASSRKEIWLHNG